MTPYIADKFTRHLEPIKQIPYVDKGGCGIVALNIYETLRRLDYNAKIISCNRYRYGYYFDNETKCRRNRDKGFDVADHYVVRVNEMYFDSHGAMSFDFLCRDRLKSDLVIKTIYKIDLEWALDNAGWNEEFYDYHNKKLNETVSFIKEHINQFKIGNNQNRNNRLSGRSHRLTNALVNCS